MLKRIQLDPGIHAAMARVEEQVRQSLKTSDPGVRKYLTYIAKTRGKRLRALLTLLAARLWGKTLDQVEHLAAAMELFHHATLIHDDIIDHALWRRNRPSLHHHFGNEIAILVGDFMFTQVMNILLRKIPEAIQHIVAQTVTYVCLGEMQEIQLVRSFRLTVQDYKKVIGQKTASLFAACCEGGARLQHAPKAGSARLRDFGYALGMAFQIRDDILDLTSRTERLGKSVGSDIQEGRLTLPLILALQRLRGKARQILVAQLKSSRPNLRFIQKQVLQSGALDQAQTMAQDYSQQAKQALVSLPASRAKAGLIQLAHFAAERKN